MFRRLVSAIDCLGDALSDSRKSATERGFDLSDPVVARLVTRREEGGDLGDAEQGIGGEDQSDEELTRSEFRLVEGRPPEWFFQ